MPARRGVTRHVVRSMVVGVGALLVSGCLSSEMAITVDGAGSGTTAIEVYFDEAGLDQSGLTQDDLVGLVETATQGVDGAEVSAVGDQGSLGVRVSIPFEDYHQLTQALTAGEYGGVSTRIFQSFEVAEGEDGSWSMNAVVDPIGFRATLAQIPAGFGGQATQLASSTELVFSMALPGKVLRSNASSVDGGTARWELTGDTQAASFTMENEPAGLLTTFQMILVGAAALLLVGFILVLTTTVGSRRRSSSRRGGRGRRRHGNAGDVEVTNQWQPKAPAPGTVGGRDERGLPVLPAFAQTVAGAAAAAPTSPPPVVPVHPPAPVAPAAVPVPQPPPPPAPVPQPPPPPAPVPQGPPAAAPQFTASPTVAPELPPTLSQTPAPPPPEAPAPGAQPFTYTVVTVQPIAYDAATVQPASPADADGWVPPPRSSDVSSVEYPEIDDI